MSEKSNLTRRFISRIDTTPVDAWNACANPPGQTYNPFLDHAFLCALETSGCIAEAQGWQAWHLLVETPQGTLAGAMPLYLKTHSLGEFVFDQAWAQAYGAGYYPKLLGAVPFTPVPGPRLLLNPQFERTATAAALIETATTFTDGNRLSSLHINFIAPEQAPLFRDNGLLLREGRQYHFEHDGFLCFDDYLASLNARRRKAVRKERREAVAAGLRIETLRGPEISEHHWDAFYRFYMNTGSRKWGTPYLNRTFFSLIGERMAGHILLVLAWRGAEPIAGALNFIGGDTLYGRYWGMSEFHPSLHFELCYYQAIEFAIAHGLRRVEAGAQGEHKLARGYLPTPTYSAHYLPDQRFRRAVEKYLESERGYLRLQDQEQGVHSPFRHGLAGEPARQQDAWQRKEWQHEEE